MQIIKKIHQLCSILIKEQVKEPISFLWILLSPCAIFYFFTFTRGKYLQLEANYMTESAWYYAYVAMSVSFFGFSFYIIGRRESGFVRSFIYTVRSRSIFLAAQLSAYSLISILYCSALYVTTKPLYGDYNFYEFLLLLVRFYCCFLLFCIFGLAFTLVRVNFQNASTILSASSFAMLATTVIDSIKPTSITAWVNAINPLNFAYQIMAITESRLLYIYLLVIIALAMTTIFSIYFFRTNPVWSRY